MRHPPAVLILVLCAILALTAHGCGRAAESLASREDPPSLSVVQSAIQAVVSAHQISVVDSVAFGRLLSRVQSRDDLQALVRVIGRYVAADLRPLDARSTDLLDDMRLAFGNVGHVRPRFGAE